MVQHEGRRLGFEIKFSEAPTVTRSIRNAAKTLRLDHLFVVCPTKRAFPVDHHITVLPATDIPELSDRIDAL